MQSVLLGLFVSACLCVATLFGLTLRGWLPDHHFDADTRDVIKLATAIVGTLSALALGLFIASAKSANDDAELELRTSSASVVLLDRLMLHYGKDAESSRLLLHRFLDARLASGWLPSSETGGIGSDIQDLEAVQSSLRQLAPQSQEQRLLQARMLELSNGIAETRWLAIEQNDESLPTAFLTVLIFWLSLLFFTFGLQAPRNATVICILAICAIAVGGAVFVVADMANPYLGLIHISNEPLRLALAELREIERTRRR